MRELCPVRFCWKLVAGIGKSQLQLFGLWSWQFRAINSCINDIVDMPRHLMQMSPMRIIVTASVLIHQLHFSLSSIPGL